MNGTKRNLRNGTLSVMVVACMLLCAITPAIINWNEEDASASVSYDDKFRYVSIGDSMTNAFGSLDYYYCYEDHEDDSLDRYRSSLGFLADDTFGYAASLARALDDELLGEFEFKQMAVGGFRSEEIRAVLYWGEYQQDLLRGPEDLTNRIDIALRALDVPDDENKYEAFSKYYRETLINANLITYQSIYGVGTAIMYSFLPMIDGRAPPEFDFTRYLDGKLVAVCEYIYDAVYDMIISQTDGNISQSLIDMAALVAKGAAYGVVADCANFDAIMSWLYEVGYEGEKYKGNVIVLDAYNIYGGTILNIGGLSVPIGDILDIVYDCINVYTKYLSKWSSVTRHAPISEHPEMMYEEYIKDGGPSDDAKAVFPQSVFNFMEKYVSRDFAIEHLYHIYGVDKEELALLDNNDDMTLFVKYFSKLYDDLNENNVLTQFLGYVSNAKVIDFMGAKAVFDNPHEFFTKFLTSLTHLRIAHDDRYGDITGPFSVEIEENESGGCDIILTYDDVERRRQSYSSVDLSFIFVMLNLLAGDNPMSHPSATGHGYVYDCLVTKNTAPFNPSFIYDAIKTSPHLLAAKDVLCDFIEEYSANSFLDLTKEDVAGLVVELTDYFEPVVYDILSYDANQKVPQIVGTKYEYLIGNGSLMAARLAEMAVDYIITDCSVYDGDVLTLRFNPLEDYDSMYFGGVFSMFDDTSDNNEDFKKTLIDVLFGMTDAERDAIVDTELIHIAPTSGTFISIRDFAAKVYLDLQDGGLGEYDPCDYGAYSAIIGEDVAKVLNSLRDEVAARFSSYLSDYVTDPEYSKAISIIMDYATFVYLGSLASMIGIIDMVEKINPDASILLYGAYNELRGVDLKVGEDILPVGDLLDKFFSGYNVLLYQLCEYKDNVAYVDVSTATTEMYETVLTLDVSSLIQIMNDNSLVPDKQVFIDGADKWIVTDNAEYEITWVTFEGTFVDVVKHGVVPEYDGALVPEGGDTYTYGFAGWDNKVTAATGPMTYVAQYNLIPNAPSVNGTVVFDVEAFDQINTATIVTDGWSMNVPSAIFDGVEGTVEITVDIVDVSEIPAEYRILAGNKKVIVLDMKVGGTEITNFGKNTVSVTFKYVPDEKEKMDNISVYWIDEANGEIVEYPATYDPKTGEVTFDTNHFSYWFIGEKTSKFDMSNVMPYIATFLVIIVGLCVALLRMKR